MGTYKYYLVETSDHDWTYGIFEDLEAAKTFAQHLITRDADFIEVLGTNQEVDICTSLETVYIWDVGEGKEAFSDVKSLNTLADRVFKQSERFQDEEGEPDTLEGVTESLQNLDGCHNIIEFLLDNIEVMDY